MTRRAEPIGPWSRELSTDTPSRFHNAQTISLSVILGVATLFLTWRPYLFPRTTSAVQAKESLRTAAFTGSIYWLAGLASVFFPGSSGLDPEFGGPGFPQGKLFAGFAGLALGGLLLG